jgi:hypothetical protein
LGIIGQRSKAFIGTPGNKIVYKIRFSPHLISFYTSCHGFRSGLARMVSKNIDPNS